MDISPANPAPKGNAKCSVATLKRTELQKPPATFNKSFFSQLTANTPRSLSSTSLHNDSLSPPILASRPIPHHVNSLPNTAPLIGARSFGKEVNPNLVTKRERSQSETNLVFGKASGNTLLKKVLPRPGLRDATVRLASASVGGNVFDQNLLHSYVLLLYMRHELIDSCVSCRAKSRPPIPAEFRKQDRSVSDSNLKKNRWPGTFANERHVVAHLPSSSVHVLIAFPVRAICTYLYYPARHYRNLFSAARCYGY